MSDFVDIRFPFFGDARNPRGFGISSDGFKFCGTFPVATPGMEDYASGYVIGWSPQGLYHVDRKEEPSSYVGISCRGVNRSGDAVGFATRKISPSRGVKGGFQNVPFFWPTHEAPVVFDFVDAKREIASTLGAADMLSGINDQGEVVGSYTDKGGHLVGFVADVASLIADPTASNPATITKLTVTRATGAASRAAMSVTPRGINNKGVIVGSIQSERVGFVTIDTADYVTVIVGNTDTFVNGINDDGIIVGQFQVSPTESHGFRWRVDASGQTVGFHEQVDYPRPDLPGKLNLRTSLNGVDNFGTAIGSLTYDDMWAEANRVQPFLHRGQYRAGLHAVMSLADTFQTLINGE